MRPRTIIAADAETDPFLHGRVPAPFIWGIYDGRKFKTFSTTKEFVEYIRPRNAIVFAHNGGKFDFMFLLPFVGETKAQIINGRIVAMFLGKAELRDSFAIMPEGLAKLGDKKEIDYFKLEADQRANHIPEITAYLEQDCRVLFDVVTTYRSKVGTQKTIASNALAFAKKLGIKPGKTNNRFDKKYRPFFFGGRTEVFQPGSHELITILDIHSAYPFAMMHDHPTGSHFDRGKKLEAMTKEEKQRSFIILECYSDGAFPKKVLGAAGGLTFPKAFGEFYVTGWEYVAALELGLIRDVKIISVRSTEATITFKDYVLHWYKMKNENPKTVNLLNYMIAKYMMNSLYGKMAQDIRRYFDYKITPAGTPICHEFNASPDNSRICLDCKQSRKLDIDHGWLLYTEDNNLEVHRRPSLWKWEFEKGTEWEGENLFHNVATGASITGFTRAHLLRAMHMVGVQNVIYCDTDSIICTNKADLSKLSFTDALGDWGIEDQNAPIGHFAGKKLYGIMQSDGKTKIASKGSKLAFKDLEDIVNGKTVTWRSPSPSFRVDGKANFVVREIRKTSGN